MIFLSYILSLTMNLFKSLLILMIFLMASCKRERPKHIWIFDRDDLEMLNGNVDQVTIGDSSSSKDEYYHTVKFDESGNLIYSEKRYLDVMIMEKKTDSTIEDTKTRYHVLSDLLGNRTAITGNVSGKDPYTSKWELNKQGQVIKYESDGVDSIGDVTNFDYNAGGDLVKSFRLHPSNHVEPDLYKYKYDKNHHIIEVSLYEPNSSMYDPEFRGKDVLLRKTRIEYKALDGHNNWTQKIEYHDTYPPMVRHSSTGTVTRIITYY